MAELFGEFESAVACNAVLSACGLYRYSLSRTWDITLQPACFVMLNPSTADAMQDDPTIRRCMNFARGWGNGGIVVVNLFAWRATFPEQLRQCQDPIGPLNDQHIREAAILGHPLVMAWGATAWGRKRARQVVALLEHAGRTDLHSLGRTRDGYPRHPLYLRRNTLLTPFVLRGE